MDTYYDYHSSDEDAESTWDEVPCDLRPRQLTESEWVDEYWDELSSTYEALLTHLQSPGGPCILQTLTFAQFCKFCYENSFRT